MGKNSKRKNQKISGQWTPPKGSLSYFSAASDYEFEESHPIGYGFLVMLGIVALLLPVILYMVFIIPIADNSPWLMLGWVGGFVIGIGLFNFVAIIIKQYWGHWVSIISFITGSILIWVSLVQLGIV